MRSESPDYHLAELQVARDPADVRHILPPIQPWHRRILDVGCGAGQTLIACDLSEDTLAAGVDPAFPALTLGRSLNPRLRLACASGESLPFRNDSFDLVYSRVALPYMHVGRALAEMSRVLKPGGDLWLTLHPWPLVLREVAASVAALRIRSALHAAYVLANGLTLHALGLQFAWPFGNGGGYESFQTSRSMRRALASAGFTDTVTATKRFFVVTAKKA